MAAGKSENGCKDVFKINVLTSDLKIFSYYTPD